MIFKFPKNKESVLSEFFSPTDIKPNPDSEVSPLTLILTLNLFEADLFSLFLALDEPSIKIELIPSSSVPIYLLERMLNNCSNSLSEVLIEFLI